MDATIGDPLLLASVERAFEKQPLPDFWEQATPRAMIVAVVLSVVFGFVTLQIQMSTGVVPGLNMPISVLSFIFLKWFVSLLRSCGLPGSEPFTRQENLLVLTTVTTVGNLALTGGFALYIIAMTSTVAKALGETNPDPRDIVDNFPAGQWMLFLLLIGLMSVLTSVPLNQVMILDYRLLFPTGTAQAHLINSFHTPHGAIMAKIQVATIFKFFFGSFSWTAFSWLYASGKDCGFSSFPLFGLQLYKKRFFFDFSATFIGVGMICPLMVNITFLVGGIVSWGLLFPFLETKSGQWYHTPSPSSLAGINGYKVFISVALILTDGIYNFITLLIAAFLDFRQKQQETDTVVGNYLRKHPSLNYDDRRRIEVFLENKIPASLPVAAYGVCAIICGVVIPQIFHQVNFLHVIAMYIIVPVVALTNTYATGLTDWNIAYTYAKFTIFVVAAWVAKPGAIIVALVSCGLVVSALHISSQMTQDVKTGYMTLTSQRALIMMQTFGVIVGSVLTPCIFRAFQRSAKANVPIGAADSEYPCPYAMLYRAMAVIGTGGVKELPDHCLTFCYAAAGFAIAVNTLSVVSQRKGWKIQVYIPSVTVLALPFFIGSAVAIDMCIGSAVIFLWMKMNSQSAAILSSAVAAGLICGEGLFALPSALFTLFSVEAPMCMKFIHSGKQVDLADSFIRNMSTPAKP
ncbi:probable metal-nicotianamine transporter YSL3 [Lolium perenne]|uniref:probable metal-nicotianamine transporter YSL3 n=1 Tax=Lolium perenne TaxID=4522 RepID=UPI0021F54E31|nr:probable metal-nicotianamine transporter YSL3 [Lolium perenne]